MACRGSISRLDHTSRAGRTRDIGYRWRDGRHTMGYRRPGGRPYHPAPCRGSYPRGPGRTRPRSRSRSHKTDARLDDLAGGVLCSQWPVVVSARLFADRADLGGYNVLVEVGVVVPIPVVRMVAMFALIDGVKIPSVLARNSFNSHNLSSR